MSTGSAGRLAGRIALITGASRGLGAAAALAYAGEGAHCILVARTVGGLEAVDDKIKAAGGSTGEELKVQQVAEVKGLTDKDKENWKHNLFFDWIQRKN